MQTNVKKKKKTKGKTWSALKLQVMRPPQLFSYASAPTAGACWEIHLHQLWKQEDDKGYEACRDLKAEARRSSLRRHGYILPPARGADLYGPGQRGGANNGGEKMFHLLISLIIKINLNMRHLNHSETHSIYLVQWFFVKTTYVCLQVIAFDWTIEG